MAVEKSRVVPSAKSPGTSSEAPVGIVLLAAGMGKRMKSQLPKVLHEIGGRPLLFHTLHQILEATPGAPVAVVVGHGREEVERRVREHAPFAGLDVTFVHQKEQRGTGDAVRAAMDSPWGARRLAEKATILVLPGDQPLMPAELVREMLLPLRRSESMRLLTVEFDDPTGYGRIVRRGKAGAVLRIVEHRDANPRERAIREVAMSIYSFRAAFLAAALPRLSNKNAQGEYYLTDLVAVAGRRAGGIDVLRWPSSEDVRGINDPWELAETGRVLNQRILRSWALRGTRFLDPWSCRVDASVELAEDVVVHPGAILRGATRVARGATLGPGVVLTDTEVGEGATVKAGTVSESSVIGAKAQVGPYAHLRPESSVGASAKIGNFVELKKTSVGEGTSVAHLSYLGDAVVGRGVNIGCGFVTCNFDGRVIDGSRKHRTVIEDDVFLGSDCQAVAPVRIGKGAYVASGSTITEDVEPDALAIARSRQVNKAGYARRLRPQPQQAAAAPSSSTPAPRRD